MQRKYKFIENPMINAVYTKELDLLITNTNPESRSGVIFYYPTRQEREYV